MPELSDENETDDFFDEEREEQPRVARHDELTPVDWYCAACGRPNDTLVDLSAGFEQEYVEDCAVCCRPNLISLLIDQHSLIISLHNELEYR